MDERDDRSALAEGFASAGAAATLLLRGKVARMPSPSSTVAPSGDSSTTRPETMSPGLCSAMYSSMLVGTSCFMLSLIWRFSGSMARTCALTI